MLRTADFISTARRACASNMPLPQRVWQADCFIRWRAYIVVYQWEYCRGHVLYLKSNKPHMAQQSIVHLLLPGRKGINKSSGWTRHGPIVAWHDISCINTKYLVVCRSCVRADFHHGGRPCFPRAAIRGSGPPGLDIFLFVGFFALRATCYYDHSVRQMEEPVWSPSGLSNAPPIEFWISIAGGG